MAKFNKGGNTVLPQIPQQTLVMFGRAIVAPAGLYFSGDELFYSSRGVNYDVAISDDSDIVKVLFDNILPVMTDIIPAQDMPGESVWVTVLYRTVARKTRIYSGRFE